MTKAVQNFASYLEWQDTIQNAVFVIKNWYFVPKRSIIKDKNCISTNKNVHNAVFNNRMSFKMKSEWQKAIPIPWALVLNYGLY